ncbi:MAG: hypothetical protein Q9166_001037 [cf. Caloplaca sp. 2 TL-2023]
MTKTPRLRADWPPPSRIIASRIFYSASHPSTSLLQAIYESDLWVCNLSPFYGYWPPNLLERKPPPAPALRKPPSLPFQSPCNLSLANPYVEPSLYDLSKMAIQGHHGVGTWSQKPDYKAYKSPYGPDIRPNFHGIGPGRAMKFGITAGSFGVVAGVFALFFFSDVPKVRTDIMQKLPFIGDHFVKEIPPSDNVSIPSETSIARPSSNRLQPF